MVYSLVNHKNTKYLLIKSWDNASAEVKKTTGDALTIQFIGDTTLKVSKIRGLSQCIFPRPKTLRPTPLSSPGQAYFAITISQLKKFAAPYQSAALKLKW